MVGVRKFDEATVLDRLVAVFWEKGYEGASIDDLVAATGLKRGSLYNAFGDKERMFLRALTRYDETVARPIAEAIGDPDADPRTALEHMFEAQIAALSDPCTPAGCLLVVAGCEAGQRTDAIGERVRTRLRAMETLIQRLLERAQARGRLSDRADPRALARYFAAVSGGISVMHRACCDPEAARDVARTALAVLAPASVGARVEASA